MKIQNKLKEIKSGELKPLVGVLKLIKENLDKGYTNLANGNIQAIIKILED